ncbi:hypothetical protein AUC69_05025 [Methyloceanibacter superfactus]|uniref:Uncharacterized protein n=1 Tax=Methyloceanibacter superfactus TaxID=1774969 RepID=A0A1E3W746_9HYPH|nr:hypothetical protein AUC69_05025 [Methyloceanibacter superfactus]
MRRGRPLLIARREPPRHLRQQHGADGDADDADGQLVDAVGVIERRQGAGGQEGGDQRVGEQRELHAAGADDRGSERLQEFPGRLIELRHAQPDAEAMGLGIGAEEQGLRHAGDEHAPGRGVAGIGEPRREQQRGDDREIEQHRRAGRRGETVIGVEDAGEQRLERHQRQIGEGDAGERDGQIEALRIADEAGGEKPDHLRREQQRDGEQHQIDGDQGGGDLVGEQLGGRQARFFKRARIGRHEGGGEGPFGEDGAEMVGQAEGHEEGVGHGPGAENGGHDHVTDEAREARDEREPADGGDAPDHALLPTLMVSPRSRQRRR